MRLVARTTTRRPLMLPCWWFLLLATAATTTEAFTLSSTPLFHNHQSNNERAAIVGTTVIMASSSQHNNNNNNQGQEEETLSNLLNSMLQSHREMQGDMKELQKSSGSSSSNQQDDNSMPSIGEDRVYRITTEEQYKNFLAAHANQLVVLKFSSPFCQACQMLKQKFRQFQRSPSVILAAGDDAVVFGDVTLSRPLDKDNALTQFVTRELQVAKLPFVHFYAAAGTRRLSFKRRQGGGKNSRLVGNFSCDPEGCSWMMLKEKLIDFVNAYSSKTTTAVSSSPLQRMRGRVRGFFRSSPSSSD